MIIGNIKSTWNKREIWRKRGRGGYENMAPQGPWGGLHAKR